MKELSFWILRVWSFSCFTWGWPCQRFRQRWSSSWPLCPRPPHPSSIVKINNEDQQQLDGEQDQQFRDDNCKWTDDEKNRTHPRRRSVLFLFAVLLHVDPLDGAAGGAHLRVNAARVRIWAARGWKAKQRNKVERQKNVELQPVGHQALQTAVPSRSYFMPGTKEFSRWTWPI